MGGIIGSLISWFFSKWLPDHPEYGQKFLYYFIRLIPFILSWKKRRIIATEIHAYITEGIKDINKKSYGYKILPKGIKIEWTHKKEKEVIIEENEIVIRLGYRANPCENFVDALLLYLSNSFMPKERIYLDSSLYEACKCQIAISMLRERNSEYYRVFIDKYYKSALDKYKEILAYSRKLESIEHSGLLTSVFLPTFSFYTEKWIFQRKSPSSEIQRDINDFLDFVFNIATSREYEKETGEKPPIDYPGKNLRLSIIPVARKELAEKFEYKPHLEKAKHKMSQDIDLLFVMGRGKNMGLAEAVCLKLKKELFCEQINGASRFNLFAANGKKIEGICYIFKRKL